MPGPHGFAVRFSAVRLRAVVRSRQGRPANTLHADAAASTASHPASVTTRDPPLMRDETAGLIVLIWRNREGICFCARGWTGQITMKALWKIAPSRIAPVERDMTLADWGQPVGWMERSDTHQLRRRTVMGFAALYPSYESYENLRQT